MAPTQGTTTRRGAGITQDATYMVSKPTTHRQQKAKKAKKVFRHSSDFMEEDHDFDKDLYVGEEYDATDSNSCYYISKPRLNHTKKTSREFKTSSNENYDFDQDLYVGEDDDSYVFTPHNYAISQPKVTQKRMAKQYTVSGVNSMTESTSTRREPVRTRVGDVTYTLFTPPKVGSSHDQAETAAQPYLSAYTAHHDEMYTLLLKKKHLLLQMQLLLAQQETTNA